MLHSRHLWIILVVVFATIMVWYAPRAGVRKHDKP